MLPRGVSNTMRYTKDSPITESADQTPLEVLQDKVMTIIQRSKAVQLKWCGFSYQKPEDHLVNEVILWLESLGYTCLQTIYDRYVRVELEP